MGSKGLEFYIYNDDLWCMFSDGRNEVVTEHETELVGSVLTDIMEKYPKAYQSLQQKYQKSSTNVPYYQYLMVRCFCKCNFGNLEGTKMDIEESGRYNFEKVSCPCRKECPYEGVICQPEFNSTLSDAELRVMNLIFNGASTGEVAERLFLSPNTIKNHIKSVYMKLGIHEKSEFVRYAENNNLFK